MEARTLSAVRNLPAYSFSYSTATRAGDDSAMLTNAMSELSSLTRTLWDITEGTTGAAQGIGWEYYMGADGAMMNSSLLDYRMPTSLDLPMIDAVIVEVNNPGHPFGVRGVGEANIAPPLAALANAIYAAAGVRMRSLPMNPQSVAAAISAGKNGG